MESTWWRGRGHEGDSHLQCERGKNLPRPDLSLWLANLGVKTLACFVKDWYVIMSRADLLHPAANWVSLFAQQKTKHDHILKILISFTAIVSQQWQEIATQALLLKAPVVHTAESFTEGAVDSSSSISFTKCSPDSGRTFLKRGCEKVRKLFNET